MRIHILVLLSLCTATATACGDDGPGQPVNEPPVLEILSPTEGAIYQYGASITFDASATDPEDGSLDGPRIEWASNLLGPLGVGTSLTLDSLAFGVHTITATAMDSAGEHAVASVSVEISELETVASWMTGHFSSGQQSVDDPSYFDISLYMARIWHAETDALWIYVEQSVTGQSPYRQRIYRLFENAGQVQDEIYLLPNEAAWEGVWETPEELDALAPADLTLKPGCDVSFYWSNERFEGGTEGEGCASSLNGASYATTQIVMEPALLSSWDQGWTADGQQVWGPTAGPYLFDKHEDFPLR